jgi:hypothetical protein
MGTMSFLLPDSLDLAAAPDLERACVAGGPDSMPWPTAVHVEPGLLRVQRAVDESGYLAAPWEVPGFGRLVGASATLMERSQPYDLQIELARGKVNQVRCQAADWRAGGLQIAETLLRLVHDASLAFGRSVTQPLASESRPQAQSALVQACHAADQLVQAYVDQVFHIRHQRHPRLDTALGCRLSAIPPEPLAAALTAACNTVCLPFSWDMVEPAEGSFAWEAQDELVAWAVEKGLRVHAGPLIDFTPCRLPEWLWRHEGNLSSLATYMCNYVERAVRRYRGRIRRWQMTAGSNCARVLGLTEEQLLWLTARLAEIGRQSDAGLELVIGIAQPWGEYMAAEDRSYSPFVFADTLIRTGLNLAALDLELVMGVTPRGSYCRDRLDASRLLDLYSLLGVPLRVTLGYPSASVVDPDADPETRVDAGRWREGFSTAAQAEWAAAFGALAVAKPYVQGVTWCHLGDAEPHQFSHAGLVDAQGNVKPALQRLQALREAHLL